MHPRPGRVEFRALAASHTVVPVWTELLADLETPVAAFAKLVGDGDGFLLESVEHGERWGRFSFIGWDPVLTMTLRDGVVSVDGPEHVEVPRDRGILAAIEAVLSVYDAPEFADLPPLSGGLIGYLGYDVVREVERLPDVPPSDQRFPGRGDEHDRIPRRLRPLAAAGHPDRERPDPHRRHRRPRCRLRRGRCAARVRHRRPRPAVAVCPGRSAGAGRGAADRRQLDAERRLPARRDGRQRAHRRRRHLPGGPRPALRLRSRRRPVRRLPHPAPDQPEPVHVLRARAGGHRCRVVTGTDGQGRRRNRDLATDRRDPQARPHRRARPPTRRRAGRTSQGARRARDARRPGAQRRRAGRSLRDGARRRVVDVGALQPRDASHVTSVRSARSWPRSDRRAPRARCRRAP